MDFYLGQIIMFGGNFAIRGFTLAEGQLLPISQNSALFSLYGTMYGGDGRTTFGLPDLRGRMPIGQGTGTGLSPRSIGARGGAETVTLNTSQIPSHNHSVEMRVNTETGNTNEGGGHAIGSSYVMFNNHAAEEAMSSSTINESDVGGGSAHNNMQPWLAICYEIATTGTFPSRN